MVSTRHTTIFPEKYRGDVTNQPTIKGIPHKHGIPFSYFVMCKSFVFI